MVTCGNVQGLVNKITKSTLSRLDIWEEKVQDGGGLMELEVHPEMCIITMEENAKSVHRSKNLI